MDSQIAWVRTQQSPSMTRAAFGGMPGLARTAPEPMADRIAKRRGTRQSKEQVRKINEINRQRQPRDTCERRRFRNTYVPPHIYCLDPSWLN